MSEAVLHIDTIISTKGVSSKIKITCRAYLLLRLDLRLLAKKIIVLGKFLTLLMNE